MDDLEVHLVQETSICVKESYIYIYVYGFYKWDGTQSGWCGMGNPTKMDDRGVPPFWEISV